MSLTSLPWDVLLKHQMALDAVQLRLQRITTALHLARSDLPQVRAAANTCNLDYFEVVSVGMLLERDNPNPRQAVHLLWAGEKVRADYLLPAPSLDQSSELSPNLRVVDLPALVIMKLQANRLHDLVHLEDLIDVGLVDRDFIPRLPPELAVRLEPLLISAGKWSASN